MLLKLSFFLTRMTWSTRKMMERVKKRETNTSCILSYNATWFFLYMITYAIAAGTGHCLLADAMKTRTEERDDVIDNCLAYFGSPRHKQRTGLIK